MHSADFDKELKCAICGTKFSHPLCDTYEYQGADRFFTHLPNIEVGYCAKCNKIVCIQKGIKYFDALSEFKNASKERKKYFKFLIDLLQGRDSVDACCNCGNTNIVKLSNYICPNCNNGKLMVVRKKEDSGIRFHVGRKYILPILSNEKAKCDINANQWDMLKTIIKWICVLPVSVIAWFISAFIIGIFNTVLSPVEISEWAITIASSGGSACAFVIAGASIAPKGKEIVSIVLATIMGVFAITSLIFVFCGYGNDSILISTISTISTIIGCVLACTQMHEA